MNTPVADHCGLSQSGSALREGVERALAGRLDVDFWHRFDRAGTQAGASASADLDASVWRDVQSLGLPMLLNAAATGGAQASLLEAAGALEALGAMAVPAPAAETMIANWCAAGAGLPVFDGRVTLAPVMADGRVAIRREGASWRLHGAVRSVPFARAADAVLVEAESEQGPVLCLLDEVSLGDGSTVTRGDGLNGEPRDDLGLDVLLPDSAVGRSDRSSLWTAGAAMRSVQMASALAAALDLSIEYVRERHQFGRPLSKFQAIQQQLAVMAAQSTLASVAARRAFAALGAADAFFAVAAAKITVGQAASQGAAIAHQVHGAMGFTAEYGLQRLTRRLWTWREEFGNETWWSQRLGQHIAAAGSERLWDLLIAEPR